MSQQTTFRKRTAVRRWRQSLIIAGAAGVVLTGITGVRPRACLSEPGKRNTADERPETATVRLGHSSVPVHHPGQQE
ncbi:MAG: hypothetical protein ACREXW_15205 [Gammaproteobacteria bacterium]